MPLEPSKELLLLLRAASEMFFVTSVPRRGRQFFSIFASSLSQESKQAFSLGLALAFSPSCPMSAYDMPSPAQGRSRGNTNGASAATAFETPASGGGASNRQSHHHRSSEANTNGFDSDASLSSVGALTRDLPPYASSPPIEAVVFA